MSTGAALCVALLAAYAVVLPLIGLMTHHPRRPIGERHPVSTPTLCSALRQWPAEGEKA